MSYLKHLQHPAMAESAAPSGDAAAPTLNSAAMMSPGAQSLLRFIEEFSLTSSSSERGQSGPAAAVAQKSTLSPSSLGSRDDGGDYGSGQESSVGHLDNNNHEESMVVGGGAAFQQHLQTKRSAQQKPPPLGDKSNSRSGTGFPAAIKSKKKKDARLPDIKHRSSAADLLREALTPPISPAPSTVLTAEAQQIENGLGEESTSGEEDEGVSTNRSKCSGRSVQLDHGEEVEMEIGGFGQPAAPIENDNRLHSLQAVQTAMQTWLGQQKRLFDCQKRQVHLELESYRSTVERQQGEIHRLEKMVADTQKLHRDEQGTLYETIQNYVQTEETFREIIRSQQKRILQLEALVGEIGGATAGAFSGAIRRAEQIRDGDQTPTTRGTDASMPYVCSPYDQTSNCSLPSCSTLSSDYNSNQNNYSMSNPSTGRRPRSRQLLSDGTEIVQYSNGAVKEKLPGAGGVIVRYANGDIETHGADGTMAYYFAATGVSKITQPHRFDIGEGRGSSDPFVFQYQFPSGQVEFHSPGGRKRVRFPDGVVQELSPDGRVLLEENSGRSPMTYSSLAVEPPTSGTRLEMVAECNSGSTSALQDDSPYSTSFRGLL